MKNIDEISTLELSKYLNALRKFLIHEGYFEHHLYSTLPYKIENTKTFSLGEKLFMRFNPEPDIWQAGEFYDKFFWIGSMFRNEEKVTPVHKKEFTVIDIYFRNGKMGDIINLFFRLLEEIEVELNLEKLSKYSVEYIKHNEYKPKSLKEDKYWLVITDYPKNESFYDPLNESKDATKKFEIFFVSGGAPIEIVACGNLGDNLNELQYISQAKRFVSTKPLSKNFIGFGFGVERLIYLYKNNEQ